MKSPKRENSKNHRITHLDFMKSLTDNRVPNISQKMIELANKLSISVEEVTSDLIKNEEEYISLNLKPNNFGEYSNKVVAQLTNQKPFSKTRGKKKL